MWLFGVLCVFFSWFQTDTLNPVCGSFIPARSDA
jgi:hypothetical protein